MPRTNRHWLPAYCNPDSYLPRIQETRTLFSQPPFLFRDFVGRALAFLKSPQVRDLGFEYDPAHSLPCKWKCADESVFSVDLALYAYTGQYPFDKGLIGGRFNPGSLPAAVKHGSINIDFGGSHVAYEPSDGGGHFGEIWRPLHHDHSNDCGYLCALIEPFRRVYQDACANILLFQAPGDRVQLSIPNEYVQPSWDSNNVKLLVDTDNLTDGTVPYDASKPHTQTPIGRTLFYLKPGLLDVLQSPEVQRFTTPTPTPIGPLLNHQFFNIFDTDSKLDHHGLPVQKLELYMKYILSSRNCPPPLKAAIVNTNLEYNVLTDAVREPPYEEYSFASFTGVFIDMYDHDVRCYLNLFQPLGISIKPAGTTSLFEISQPQIHSTLRALAPVAPKRSLQEIMGFLSEEDIIKKFAFTPGSFQ